MRFQDRRLYTVTVSGSDVEIHDSYTQDVVGTWYFLSTMSLEEGGE